MICGDARIDGIAGRRHRQPARPDQGTRPGEKPRFGGIVYAESAEKVAFFIERCDRQGIPLLFVQDVSGFMVGPEAEHEGIIRAGARFVEAMATARVPKIVLTVNHASGAGYYAMAGQGFDPDFIFSLADRPHGGDGRRERRAGGARSRARRSAKAGQQPRRRRGRSASIEEMRADYEHQLDARYAAARGFVDAIVYPEDTRDVLAARAPRRACRIPGPHLGPFVSPSTIHDA